MRFDVEVVKREVTKEGMAVVRIIGPADRRLCALDVQASKLASLRCSNSTALDFLLLASVVYALDKLVPRAETPDAWTRDITFTLPVSSPGVWKATRRDVVECLSFLTGDRWRVDFTEL